MYYDAIENPVLFGKLPTFSIGGPVTIRLVKFPGNEEIPLDTVRNHNVCTETPIPGYWSWDFALVDRCHLPVRFDCPLTILYVMRNDDGYEFSGKIILGHFPELVRRIFGIVQVGL